LKSLHKAHTYVRTPNYIMRFTCGNTPHIFNSKIIFSSILFILVDGFPPCQQGCGAV